MMMVALEIGLLTPPFGILLFVVQGVLGGTVTMTKIYKSVMPFIGLQLGVLLIIFLVPGLTNWLPNIMK